MSVVETILIFVVIPLAIVLLFMLLTLVPGREKKVRYKPGQAWDHRPIWWEPRPLHGPSAGGHDDEPQALGSSVYPEPLESGAEAGAPAQGATAVTTRPAPTPSGPLGGARGTW